MPTIFTESFETDGNGTRYVTSVPEFSDGSNDFFTRTDGSNIGTFYEVTGQDGSFFFAAQDIDGEGASSQQTLSILGIDISGFESLSFSALLAEDDDGTNQDWDEPDFVIFEYQIDGGGFQNLLAVQNDGSTFNSAPLIDTDFDGTGDGTEITNTFAAFSAGIVGTGSMLDLRVTFDLNAGDEDIALDNIVISGDAAGAFDLQITEIWSGQEGADLTEDWFEITNVGDVAWVSGVDADLFYDDESADPTTADAIQGITDLQPGESAIVLIGDNTAVTPFIDVWGEVIDLTGVEVGFSDGAGLGGGGDAVNLFVDAAGDGADAGDIVDTEAYPDTTGNSGRSFDVDLQAFSVDGAGGAVTTIQTAGASGDEPAVGSPGNGAAIVQPADFTLELLHVTDQEGSTAQLTDIIGASAVLNALDGEDLGGDGETDNTIRLSSGDAFIPGVFFDASEAVFGSAGIADILIQNEMGFQAIALGNHEFDLGTADLAALIDGSAAGVDQDGNDFTGTAFPYLSANLDFSTDANLAPLAVAGGLAPQANVVTSSTILDVNGEQVAVVGATVPTLGSISSPGDVGISPLWAGGTPTPEELDALAAIIQAEVDALLAANQDLNKVILSSHMQQISIEEQLAERLTDVDIIIAGGSNTRLFDENDVPRAGDSDQGQYPTFITDLDGNTTAVVNTDGSYKYVGRLVIDFDANGNIDAGSYDETVSGAYATDAAGVAALGAAGQEDADVVEIVNLIEAEIISTEGNVFGVSDVFLNGNRSGTFAADDPDGVRTQETNLGNLTADANLAYANEIVSDNGIAGGPVLISIKNGGGIRANIGEIVVPAGGTEAVRQPNGELVDGAGDVIKPEGGISQTDIQGTLAFNNGLVLVDITRQELVNLLEGGVSALPGVDGGFLQIAGLKFSFDETQQAQVLDANGAIVTPGERVQNAGIFDENGALVAELVRDGQVVGDPTEAFRAVTLNFLVDFGDPIIAQLNNLSNPNRVDLYDLDADGEDDEITSGAATFADDGTEQDALAEYLNDNFNPDNGGTAFDQVDTGPDTDDRIQNLSFRADTVLPGDAAFTLSLLHFTDQEANAATIDNIDNLSGVLNALRDEDVGADGTLTLSSGDAIIPGLFFDASEAVFGSPGIADIQIQNELGVEAIALGNHEFDLGTGLLAGLIDGSAPGDFSALSGTALDGLDFTGTDMPYLSTNLDFSTDPNLAPLAVPGGLAPQGNVVTSSVVIDANGEDIGVVGATVPTIRSISSPGDDLGIAPAWASGTPTDEELDALAAIIQGEVDALLTANPDMNKVILLSHMQQISIELSLAERLEGVDIIVAGGSNTRLFDDNDRIRDGDSDQGQYPQFVTNAGGTTTAVVNTDGTYKYVGRLVIDFDEDGNLLPGSYDEDISGAFATDDQGVTDLGAAGLIDPEIDAITDAIQAQIVATESNVFGVSDVFLNGNRSGTFAADDPDGVRTQETNLGNLTADANLAYANQMIADNGLGDPVVISIKNGGGIRANIGEIVVPAGGTEAVRVPNSAVVDENGVEVKPEGGISQNDIATTLAFNNGLTLLDITKSELKDFLEGSVAALPTGVSGGFPQISGLKFSFDETRTAQTYDIDGNIATAGERVLNAGVFDEAGTLIAEIVRDGQIVGDPTESFRIVTLNFLANAGDEILSSLSNPNRVDLIDLDADGADDGNVTGAATFADDGTEQDALAEYLNDNFNPDNGGTAFNEADTGPADDQRIQNLTFRNDTVLPEELPEALFDIAVAGSITLDGAEIVDFDATTGQAFVTSGGGLQVIDASDIANLAPVATLSAEDLGFDSADVTSVSVRNGVVAVARPDPTGTIDQEPSDAFTGAGQVLFYSADTLGFLGFVQVGPLPDMLVWNEAGTHLLVANEGQSSGDENQPDALENPNGSVSIIEFNASNPTASAVTTLDFTDSSIDFDALEAKGVRVNRDAPSAAADLEPEYITIEGNTAFIALQENNAVAVIDDITAPTAFTIDDILALGTKDHSVDGNGMDASNRDGRINIDTYDVNGMFMPDGMASYEVGGATFFVTANEGDGRDVDESRGADLVDGDLSNGEIDTTEVSAELQAQLADDALLGRLKFSNVDGDIDGDGLIEELNSFGARSFTIFDETGTVVFDSGDDFEQITAQLVPDFFNSTDGDISEFDDRSDDKGPEPESVVLGEINGSTYAFIGLERVGGIMMYDVTDPANSVFVQYIRNDADIAPEGLRFIGADESPTGNPLLAVASEESNTLTFHEIDLTTKIHDIQGNTDFSSFSTPAQVGVDDISPLLGQEVTVEAIVTADMQSGTIGSDLGGFFLQEEDADADGDAGTSEGIFVFDALVGTDVNVGDLVRVTGTVGEFFGMTQISASFLEVVSTGNTLPTATVVEFPTTGIMLDDDGDPVADLESVEGMLVTISTELSVTEMFNLDRFGEYRLSSDGRLEQFTQSNAPDQAGFAQHLEDNAARSIVFDDGRTDQNPETLEIIDGNDGILTATDSFRMGDTITNATGVLNYAFDEFRLQDGTGDYAQVNPRPATPDDVGGNFTVASLNVLNFFTTIDNGSNVTDTGLGPRGADDLTRFGGEPPAGTDPLAEFNRQLDKIVAAIVEIDADVIGLVELENTADDRAISALVDAVNAVMGAGTYAFIDAATQNGGPIGGDAITNGLIYKPAEVTPVGDVAILDDASDVPSGRDFIDPLAAGRPLNRPAVAQTFEDNEHGESVTIAVNHLKSKGSLSGLPDDEDQGDGQGNNNATRTEAADVLAEWLATDPTGQASDNTLIVGDLNAYAQEDPITLLEALGFTDFAAEALNNDTRSFVFDGQTGTLDYALGNEDVTERLRGATEWHINADEADAIDYNLDFGRDPNLFDGTTPARNSDHDPVIIGLDLRPEVEGVNGVGFDRVEGTAADEIIDGDGGNDVYIGGGGADLFTARIPGTIRVLDFNPVEDTIDVSEWGTQSFEELAINSNGAGDRVIIRDIITGESMSLLEGSISLEPGDLTADSFVFDFVRDLEVSDGGDPGVNSVRGRQGDDIYTGTGNDAFIGSAGDDIFTMNAGDRMRVIEFNPTEDKIDISAWGTTDFSELSIGSNAAGDRLVVRDTASGDLLSLIEGSIALEPEDLDEDSFIFADLVV